MRDLGDFLVRIAIDEGHRHGRALLFVQPRQPARQVQTRFQRSGRRRQDIGKLVDIGQGHSISAQTIDDRVPEHLPQPGHRRAARRIIAAGVQPDTDIDFLQHVLGHVTTRQKPLGEAVKTTAGQIVEMAKRDAIAIGDPHQQQGHLFLVSIGVQARNGPCRLRVP